MKRSLLSNFIIANAIVCIFITCYFLLFPCITAIQGLWDPAISGPGVSKLAWRVNKSLVPRYVKWVKQFKATQKHNSVASTEWPLFGSVFFLWAQENLQEAWGSGDHTSGIEPRIFAKEAINSAAELVADPKNAEWVKRKYGEDYPNHENLFYRYLVLSALTSRELLLRDGKYNDQLRDQLMHLTKEFQASSTGLINDYPNECYPADVIAATTTIQKASKLLGVPYQQFVDSEKSHFSPETLPPYMANAETGQSNNLPRGCANSYLCATTPDIWPTYGKDWMEIYIRDFWDTNAFISGFREYPRSFKQGNWYGDADSGPVIAGYGVSASAFGIGAARKNGRFDIAYSLSAEMLTATIELPNGVLLMPYILSSLGDAPLLGESAILWQLSIQPSGTTIPSSRTPLIVPIVLGLMLTTGIVIIIFQIRGIRDIRGITQLTNIQVGVWIYLIFCAIAALIMGHWLIAISALYFSSFIVREKNQNATRA